jgi:hypothetical protein
MVRWSPPSEPAVNAVRKLRAASPRNVPGRGLAALKAGPPSADREQPGRRPDLDKNLPRGMGPVVLLLLLLALYHFTTLGVDSDPQRPACAGGCLASTLVELHAAPDSPDHLLIEVRLSGAPHLFLLDTGSEVTYLDVGAAHEHGLLVNSRPILGAVNGRFGIQRLVGVGELAVGDFTYDDFEIGLIDLGSVRDALGAPVAGVLGMNVLGFQSFVLDFSGRVLQLDVGASSVQRMASAHGCAHAVPAHWMGRGLYVPVAIGGQEGLALVDSGAFPSEIDRKLAVGLPTEAPHRVTSYSARSEADETVVRTVVPELRVGSLEATRVPMLIADESVLGADFFHAFVLGVPLGGSEIVIASPRSPEGHCPAAPQNLASGVASGS